MAVSRSTYIIILATLSLALLLQNTCPNNWAGMSIINAKAPYCCLKFNGSAHDKDGSSSENDTEKIRLLAPFNIIQSGFSLTATSMMCLSFPPGRLVFFSHLIPPGDKPPEETS